MAQLKWYRVLGAEEAAKRIPKGNLQLVKLGQQRICIAHTDSGYAAFSDICPHLGESLTGGNINFMNEVICPLHGYRFNMTNGRECQQRTQDLEIHKIELRADGLFLGVRR